MKSLISLWIVGLSVVVMQNAVATPNQEIRQPVTASGQIENYRRVVSAMQSLPATNPSSWKYQAGMHQYFTLEDVESLKSLILPSALPEWQSHALAPDATVLKNNTWAQCHQNEEGTRDEVFLLWHRVYLYYFERIARKVSGQKDFSIPYWPYTMPDVEGVTQRVLPLAFREKTLPSGETNVLYQPRRDSINAGGLLNPNDVVVDAINNYHTFELMQENMERTPHNVLHGAIGRRNLPGQWDGILMGIPNFAAQDPIFWLHHANIDRLWSCWIRAKKPDQKVIASKKKYNFVNENGKMVSHTAAQMVALVKKMKYQYADYSDCEPGPVLKKSPAKTKPLLSNPIRLYHSAVEARLETSKLVVPLMADAGSIDVWSSKNLTLKQAPRAMLTIEVLAPQLPSGISYDIALRKKGGVGAGTHVGVMSFFGVDIHRALGHNKTAPKTTVVTFDASGALMRESTSGIAEELEVVIVPRTGSEGDILNNQPLGANFTPTITRFTVSVQ